MRAMRACVGASLGGPPAHLPEVQESVLGSSSQERPKDPESCAMTNSAWWSKAYGTPAGENRRGLESDETLRTHTIWTLIYKSHTAIAELWAIRGLDGFDLRYTIDGQLRATALFKGADGGTRATLTALDKRDELLVKGWA